MKWFKQCLEYTHTTEEGEKFALEVMNHLNETCQKWKKETGLGFGLIWNSSRKFNL